MTLLKKPAAEPTQSETQTGTEKVKQHALVEAKDYIFENYDIRKNTLSLELEVVNKETGETEKADDEFFNDLWYDMTIKGYKVSSDAIVKIINNKRHIIKVNPLRDYLEGLKYDGKIDYITQLAATIKMEKRGELEVQANLWPEYLKRWLVASVGCVLSASVNQWCIVLNGGGGKGKSAWCNRLVPESLNDYLYSGHIEPKNNVESTSNFLAEKWIINLEDQLQGLQGQEYHHMKNIITVPSVTNRKAFHRTQPKRPRIASFIASVDDPSFLVGYNNRRWLVFTVENIKYDHKVDIDNVWAQAVHLFLNGYRYWFNQEENNRLNEINKIYQVVQMEEELLMNYFKPAQKTTEGAEHLSGSEIFNFIQDKTKRTLNTKIFHHAMEQNKFERTGDWKENINQTRYGYWVTKLNTAEPVKATETE